MARLLAGSLVAPTMRPGMAVLLRAAGQPSAAQLMQAPDFEVRLQRGTCMRQLTRMRQLTGYSQMLTVRGCGVRCVLQAERGEGVAVERGKGVAAPRGHPGPLHEAVDSMTQPVLVRGCRV